MKKKVFVEIVSAIGIIFTSLTLLNTGLTLAGLQNHPPAENNLLMLCFTLIGTLMVYSHKLFDEWSLLKVILLQYLVAVFMIFAVIKVSGIYMPLDPNAYKDGFRSFSIPYVIAASYYYYRMYKDAKRSNEKIQVLRGRINKQTPPT